MDCEKQARGGRESTQLTNSTQKHWVELVSCAPPLASPKGEKIPFLFRPMYWVFGFNAKNSYFCEMKPWFYFKTQHPIVSNIISGHWALCPIISTYLQ